MSQAKRAVAAPLTLAIVLILGSGAPVLADDAYIVNVIRGDSTERVTASATLRGAFTREIKDTIASGAPVTFTYFVQLKRIRPAIWDKTVRNLVIKRMVKYGALKKEYLTWEKRAQDPDDIDFKQELKGVDYAKPSAAEAAQAPSPEAEKTIEDAAPVMEPMVIKKSAELERWMSQLKDVDLGPVDGMKLDSRYFVRVRCKMKSIRLIPPFNYILFFMSVFDFDTDWTQSTTFTLGGSGGGDKTAPTRGGASSSG